jgi:hypothetical protein
MTRGQATRLTPSPALDASRSSSAPLAKGDGRQLERVEEGRWRHQLVASTR